MRVLLEPVEGRAKMNLGGKRSCLTILKAALTIELVPMLEVSNSDDENIMRIVQQ